MYDSLFSTDAMIAVLSDQNFVRQMHRFEVNLTKALEASGLAPEGSWADIQAINPDSFDLVVLAREARYAGNICIPFVKMLTESVRSLKSDSAAYVHWGATSQDVIDTATMLQLKQALPLVQDDLNSICDYLAVLANKYRHTVMPGRTWLQQGPPVTLGLKFATWLDAMLRHQDRVKDITSRAVVLQFGGAVGTLAALGGHGIAVYEKLALELDLPASALPWHTQRDRIAEIATTLGLLVGTLGKIARDISLLMQTEVAEVLEPSGAGRGGSSTMPHKRNPVGSAAALSAAIRMPGLVSTILSAMLQEHERGIGGWQAEWETLNEILRITAGALASIKEIVSGITVESAAMQRNLNLLHGATMAEAVSFALAKELGKEEAHRLIEKISKLSLKEGISMLDALTHDPFVSKVFSLDQLTKLLDPRGYLGSSGEFIDRVLHARPGQDNASD